MVGHFAQLHELRRLWVERKSENRGVDELGEISSQASQVRFWVDIADGQHTMDDLLVLLHTLYF